MKKYVILFAGTAVTAVGALAPAAIGSTPAVSVTIKTQSRTLVSNRTVHGQTGSFTRGGTPKGKCPGSSAAGALNAATHGRWSGKYYASVGGIFITSILGVKPTGSSYWSLSVNGKTSSKGMCAVKLTPGEKLRFQIVK